MTMIRVWGGGQYEPGWFYDLCSELGLMVWQDFMFSCSLYPAHDHAWLSSVRREVLQQIRRLSGHPCMALWCGDNEVIGALTWYPGPAPTVTAISPSMHGSARASEGKAMARKNSDVAFRPSSPSVGPLDFRRRLWH